MRVEFSNLGTPKFHGNSFLANRLAQVKSSGDLSQVAFTLVLLSIKREFKYITARAGGENKRSLNRVPYRCRNVHESESRDWHEACRVIVL